MSIALLPIALLSAAVAAPQQETSRVFPAEVELVAVDMIVVDADGRPVPDLGPSEFRVEVGGRPRKVTTAEYVSVAQEPDASPARAEAGYATNETVRPGRLVLLVVDTANIPAGQGREQVAAASAMLDRLGPTDRVGLLTIPSSGPREEFTTDHDRVRLALTKVVGQQRVTRRLSVTEALSCAGELGVGDLGGERCAEAIRRECSGESDLQSCAERVRAEAWAMAHEYQAASGPLFATLLSTFQALERVEGRKVVILISRGFWAPQTSVGDERRQLATAAGAARVALYVVPADAGGLPAMESNLPVGLLEEDRRLHSQGLEALAADAGGAFFRGAPERAFERVLRETSGYYRLGFEPEGNDRDGKSRSLRVSVTRPAVQVRARPSAVFEPVASLREAKGALVAALRSPTLATTLPVRVATWSLAGNEPGKTKLLIGAEIGGEAEAKGLGVGYVLFDPNGKVAASASQTVQGEAIPSGPIHYSTSVSVVPGSYTLRLAVRDGRGRVGSVDHHVEAGLVRAGAVSMSDLVLGRAPEPGTTLRPAVVPDLEDGVLLVRGELTGDEDVLASTSASLEIVSSETGRPVLATDVRLAPANGPGRRVLQVPVPLQGLAPGSYLARVVVASAGVPQGAVVRPFRVTSHP